MLASEDKNGQTRSKLGVAARRTWTNSRGAKSPSDREALALVAGKASGTTLTVDGRRGLDIESEEMATAGSQVSKGARGLYEAGGEATWSGPWDNSHRFWSLR